MLSDTEKEFLRKPNIGHLATIGPEGTPHSTPVWVDVDEENILVNTARGRVKMKNVEREPRIALSVHDEENPLRMIAVRGKVTEITEEGANTHLDGLTMKYLGKERYEWHAPGEVRVILKIEPEHVVSSMI